MKKRIGSACWHRRWHQRHLGERLALQQHLRGSLTLRCVLRPLAPPPLPPAACASEQIGGWGGWGGSFVNNVVRSCMGWKETGERRMEDEEGGGGGERRMEEDA